MKKEYKTPLSQRLAVERYTNKHIEQIRRTSKNWKIRNPLRVKQLNDKFNKIYSKTNNARRITFKGKGIHVKSNPRTGVCSKCDKSVEKGEIKRTNMHHTKYDETNPLANTIELCISCHRKEHRKNA